MVAVDIKLNVTGEFKFLLDRLKDEKKTRKGIASAMNRALKSAKTAIVNDAARVTGIKKKSRLYKRVNYLNATEGELHANLRIIGRPIAAINFPNLVTKKYGVVFRTSASETQHWRHGFKGVGLVGKGSDPTRGNAHLWIRKGKDTLHYVRRAHHQPNIYRLMEEIRPLYGPRLATVYQRNPSMQAEAVKAAQKVFRQRVISQLKRFMTKQAYEEMYFNQGVEFATD